jgi:hypothetical protein
MSLSERAELQGIAQWAKTKTLHYLRHHPHIFDELATRYGHMRDSNLLNLLEWPNHASYPLD